MITKENISLKSYVTMQLGGKAKRVVIVRTNEEVRDICLLAKKDRLPLYVLGDGSNTIVTDDGYHGIVMILRTQGFSVLSNIAKTVRIKVAGGENWDKTVEKTVAMGLSGIEALSAIPGTVGAAPVQNIGAYGQEVANVIESVDVYDRETDQFLTLSAEECQFGYRSSIFRGSHSGRYIITDVIMNLTKHLPEPPFYRAVEDYIAQHDLKDISVQTIREVVINIRHDKLPNPINHPNTGSFFKNAVVDSKTYKHLASRFKNLPSYPMPNGHYKIPTGWLIEQTGLKGKVLHGMRLHDRNALVLINESARSYQDLAAARQEIIDAVNARFSIIIEQEPLIMPSS